MIKYGKTEMLNYLVKMIYKNLKFDHHVVSACSNANVKSTVETRMENFPFLVKWSALFKTFAKS